MKNLLVKKNIRLLTALNKLSLSGEKTLIVINKNQELIGTISDGDIRNKLLKNNNLNNNIEDTYNKKPTFLKQGKFSKKDVEDIFLKNHFDLIPIVNKKNVVVDYITWGNFFKNSLTTNNFNKIDTLVIMAGGEGSRLKPFTNLLPKPLLPLNGKPIIDLIIEKFKKFNIDRYIFSVRSKSKILKAYLSEKNYKNLHFIEEKKPLGTAGSLALMKKKIKNDFLLTNCDILTDINIESLYDTHYKNKNLITLVVSAKKLSLPYGICQLNENGLFNNIKEKPVYNFFVNVGLYLINRKAISFIPSKKEFHMTDLIKTLKKKKLRVGVYLIQDEEWVDVGQWSEYKKALDKI